MDKSLLLEKILTGHIGELRARQALPEWSFKTGALPTAEKKDFDDSGWEKIMLGWANQWKAGEVPAWFRRQISIPGEINGIDLKGAKLEGNFSTPLGGEIYVDGRRVAAADILLPDIIFPIKENIQGAEQFQLTVKTSPGEGWGITFFARIYIDKIDAAIFQLEVFLNLLRLTKAVLNWRPALKRRYERIIARVLERVDLKSLEEKNLGRAMPSIIAAQELFGPIAGETRKLNIHLIGHAHIDMNWLWTWPSTLSITRGTFRTVHKLMDKFPDFNFSQSQAGLYQAVEQNFPELFKVIKKRVQEKRWELTATTWVEGDLNTAAGETLVRQTLYARKYIQEKFGLAPRIAWCPDTFGHVWTYPQILKKSGIDFYYAHRCRPAQAYPLFWWEGPDGSRVLALVTGETYNSQITPNLCAGLIDAKSRTGLNHYFVSHGVGDHGGGPTLRDLARVKRLQQVKPFPRLKFDFAENYFKAVLKEKKNLPVVKHELNSTFEGCYTTHADAKMYNRLNENMVPAAELINSMASIYGHKYYRDKLEKAWQNTCFNQFHDILCGSAIKASYGDGAQHAKTLFNETMALTRQVMDDALKSMAGQISYQAAGRPVIIFNPLSWPRRDVALIPAGISENINLPEMSVYDEQGNYVPAQFNGAQLIFTAEVPAAGYRVYYLRRGIRQETEIPVGEDAGSITVDTALFKLSIDKNSGGIRRLFDKSLNKEWMCHFGDSATINDATTFPDMGNLLQVYYEKSNYAMSAWIIGRIARIENILAGAKVKIREKGPVRVVLNAEHKILNSTLNQEIIIYRDLPRLDFYSTADWQEKGDQAQDRPMLRVAFPTSITSAQACFEIPFGHVYRPTNGQEVPQLNWLDLSGKSAGISLLNNAKYGCSVSGNTIKLTLIRSAFDPDPVADVGFHQFAYALYPHRGDWKKAGTAQRGCEFNQPLRVYVVSDQERSASKNKLAERCSFITLRPANLILTAFKKSECQRSFILRFYEAHGQDTEGEIRLNLPVKKAQETDLMENNLAGGKLAIVKNRIKLKVGKYEIKTIKLQI